MEPSSNQAMKPGLFFGAVAVTFVLGFAVGRVSTPQAGPGAPPLPPTSAVPSAAPAMNAAPTPSPAAGGGFAGTVAEVIQVPNYTYLRLNTPQGERWAAVTTTHAVQPGQAVRLASAVEMTGFASKSLNRTFDSIWFGELDTSGTPGAAPPAPAPEGLPPGHPSIGEPGPSAAAGALAALDQAGPALSLRVADVFAERAALSGKRVRVRGTAAKVTSVQGTFYLHLKDGSGTAGQDDDLTVLTATEVKVDQSVTIEGRVALNKDVGMGTPYPVVVESATVVGN